MKFVENMADVGSTIYIVRAHLDDGGTCSSGHQVDQAKGIKDKQLTKCLYWVVYIVASHLLNHSQLHLLGHLIGMIIDFDH